MRGNVNKNSTLFRKNFSLAKTAPKVRGCVTDKLCSASEA